MTEESRTDFSSNQSRKPFFSPAYATKQGTINRNFPSVSFPNSFPRSARALVLLKKPIIQPSIQTFQQNLTVHDSPKSDRHDKRNPPIHPRQSARSGERSDPSIDRVGSRRVARRPWTTSSANRVPSVRHPASHHPYRAARNPRRSVTDRARSMPMQVVPRSSLHSRGSHAHTAHPSSVESRARDETHLARRLLGGNLSGTTARGVRGGDDDSGGAHGKHFVFAGSSFVQ